MLCKVKFGDLALLILFWAIVVSEEDTNFSCKISYIIVNINFGLILAKMCLDIDFTTKIYFRGLMGRNKKGSDKIDRIVLHILSAYSIESIYVDGKTTLSKPKLLRPI